MKVSTERFTKEAAIDTIEVLQAQASRSLDSERRAQLGQFLTPTKTAQLLATMFGEAPSQVDLLDPGAGSGALFASTVLELVGRDKRPEAINITAYELDEALLPFLARTAAVCEEFAANFGVSFSAEILHADFIAANVESVRGGLWADTNPKRFSHVIMNPPYGKTGSDSQTRRLLHSMGIETGNLYTSFLAVACELLAQEGELVAITPRSFCNGPYFRQFRHWFLKRMAIDHAHVFDSRSAAFRSDDVLQENLVIHARRSHRKAGQVTISSSDGDTNSAEKTRLTEYDAVVHPDDPESVIYIVPDEWGSRVAARMEKFRTRLDDLQLSVSTGRVVDFRVREMLRNSPAGDTFPLVYPGHFASGYVRWPRPEGRKPNALARRPETADLAVPPGCYVLVRRFSAKEEPRRIVAAVYNSADISPLNVGFENHLNYYHSDGSGLPIVLARGLAAYLNSSIVDQYFRLFSGHTQVNASDLRHLRYPSRQELQRLGGRIPSEAFPSQSQLDQIVREELYPMADETTDPIQVKARLEEALEVLSAIGMPKAQTNERSALTLLALLGLKPETPWEKASDPLIGITPVMEFAREQYGKNYAPNTRETFRRQTMHQFVDAGLSIPNPDDPERPVNSPDYVYQIESHALVLLKRFGTAEWDKSLMSYLSSVGTLRDKYAQEREMEMIAIRMPDGVTLNLTPGGQNVLVEEIVDEFCPRFTPGAVPIYIGDAGEKFAYFDEQALARLGVKIEEHGKMPDVLVHHVDKGWLVVIEAVTSHGPVDPKRRMELLAMFEDSKPALVFVTAFLTRSAMINYLSEIAWETEVWIAEDASHLIHFNGERFLGPYDS